MILSSAVLTIFFHIVGMALKQLIVAPPPPKLKSFIKDILGFLNQFLFGFPLYFEDNFGTSVSQRLTFPLIFGCIFKSVGQRKGEG